MTCIVPSVPFTVPSFDALTPPLPFGLEVVTYGGQTLAQLPEQLDLPPVSFWKM